MKMAKMAICFIIVAAALMMPPPGISAASDSGRVVVLTFHEVVKSQDEVSNSAVISAAELEKTILSLKKRGYQFLDPREFLNYLDGTNGTKLSGKNLLITFDDGYEGVWKNAFPILSEYGIKAIVFPVLKWYSSFPRQEPHRPHLTVSQTLELMRAGWIIGSHSFDAHWKPDGNTPFLLKQKGESEYLYELRLYWDIVLSKKEMSLFGKSPYFAFPYGAYNATVVEMLKLAGFKYFFTSEPGFVRPGNIFIPRISAAQTAEETVKVIEGLDW